MAKSKKMKFIGKGAWFNNLLSTDSYKGNEFWKISLYPDTETLKKIKAAGIQSVVKEDDGEKSGVSGKYLSFRRDVEKTYGKKTRTFEAPYLVDKDGDDFQEDILLGNGTVIEVEVEVYPTKQMGNGTRLVGVRLLDIIEYDPEEKETDDWPADAGSGNPDEEPEEEVEEREMVKPKTKTGTRRW